MKIMYLHGLYSSPQADKVAILTAKCEVLLAPQLDYFEHPDLFGYIIGEAQASGIDFVVGSSAGGLMGYYLAQVLGIKALLFNPAIAKMNLRPDIVKHKAADFTKKSYFCQLVLGAKDETIVPQTTLDYLATHDVASNYAYHILPELEHKIPLDVFGWAVENFVS